MKKIHIVTGPFNALFFKTGMSLSILIGKVILLFSPSLLLLVLNLYFAHLMSGAF